jgi:hypothetical protein
MPRKAKKRRVYRTKEETKERKRQKQKQRQKQEQNVNIKVGSSGSSPQSIPTVISNTHYVPQQQNNDNLLALLMKSIKQEQPVIKELPKTFRNMSIGEDVPIQSLSDQVQFPNDDQSISDNSYATQVKVIDDDAYPIENNEQNITERLKPPIAIPILDEDEEYMEVVPRKRKNIRVKPRENLFRDVEILFPDDATRNQVISSYKKENNIKKSYQNFNIKELEDLLSYLTSKN